MTRVDFYILAGAGADERERLACRLAEKAYEQGHRALLLAADEAQCQRLDALLWTFRQGSFVPHARLAEREGEPVAVGTEEDGEDEVLINLSDATPASWSQRERLAEIVDQRPAVLQASRQRYRQYREAGAEAHTHHLEQGKGR